MAAVGASQRVFELIDRVPRINHTGGATLPAVTGMVKFDRITCV
jgi:hypothetical protein